MAKPSKNILHDPHSYRKNQELNQFEFWSRYGVTQSGGSRYETGRHLPKPTAMLVWLHAQGRISDKDLKDALTAVNRSR